jgi:hypothetical protein
MIIVSSRRIDTLKVKRCRVDSPGSNNTAIAIVCRWCVGVGSTEVLPRKAGSNENVFRVDGEIVRPCQKERREDIWETLVESLTKGEEVFCFA